MSASRTPRRPGRRVEAQRAGGVDFLRPQAGGRGGTEQSCRPGGAAGGWLRDGRGSRREQKTALCDAGAGARSYRTAEPFKRLRRITTPSVQGVRDRSPASMNACRACPERFMPPVPKAAGCGHAGPSERAKRSFLSVLKQTVKSRFPTIPRPRPGFLCCTMNLFPRYGLAAFVL